jgi:hypothetical protein
MTSPLGCALKCPHRPTRIALSDWLARPSVKRCCEATLRLWFGSEARVFRLRNGGDLTHRNSCSGDQRCQPALQGKKLIRHAAWAALGVGHKEGPRYSHGSAGLDPVGCGGPKHRGDVRAPSGERTAVSESSQVSKFVSPSPDAPSEEIHWQPGALRVAPRRAELR